MRSCDLPALEKIIVDEEAPVRERLRALEMLARYGGVVRYGQLTDTEALLAEAAALLQAPEQEGLDSARTRSEQSRESTSTTAGARGGGRRSGAR